ncbi:MAG: nicotinate (nicotinamide) nucleotide adenylyltransferase [Acidobacteria bacterium]|nr:nicotinate (nicotinamide) nucleotide adenylyltransferase [Acidobacteriota bacterium]
MGIVRIGVLGGTFNPIHLGHLHIARSIQRIFSLSQVHFVVAMTPPHKTPENLISFSHRYAMVSLAVAGIPSFIPSMIELEPQRSSFTIDTMRKLADNPAEGKRNFYFIAGGDSLMEVNSWRRSETLLTSYNFIFVVRPGIDLAEYRAALPKRAVSRVRDLTGLGRVQMQRRLSEENERDARIYIVDAGAPDISATRIRSLLASGKPVHRMVSKTVCEYIRKLRLYGGR